MNRRVFIIFIKVTVATVFVCFVGGGTVASQPLPTVSSDATPVIPGLPGALTRYNTAASSPNDARTDDAADSLDDRRSPDVRYDPSQPVPYDPDEFPQWSRDLRRGEIIAIGAFPVAMIVTGLVYELGRFGYYSARDGEVSGTYAPWFFSTSPEGEYTNGERIGLVITSGIISVGVAGLDYYLGRREAR